MDRGPIFLPYFVQRFWYIPRWKPPEWKPQGGSKTFFAETDRSTLPRLTPHSNVGYGGPGNEALNARRAADLKEVFNVRKETLTETWMKAVCLFFLFRKMFWSCCLMYGIGKWTFAGCFTNFAARPLKLHIPKCFLVGNMCSIILAFNCLFPIPSRGFPTIPRMAHWHFTTASLATVKRYGIYAPVQHSVHCWHLAQLCNWMIQRPSFLGM